MGTSTSSLPPHEPTADTSAPGKHWKTIREQVDQRLLAYCQEQQTKAAKRNDVELRLWQLLSDVTMGGGKRLRPYLVVWAYEAFGSKSPSGIIDAASAWEMLHQALLIHDDIIDRDYVRHGQPNVAGRLQEYYTANLSEADRNHYADSGALLAGDLALSSAYRLLLGSGFPAEQTMQACEVLAENLDAVAGGELLDTEAAMEPLGTTDCLLVAEFKTAGYSFVGPLQTGAVLAGADAATLPKLAQLGKALGIAFQLRDDILGLFGDEAVTGKPNDSDVHEGKQTLLLQYALKAASAADKAHIRKVVGDPAASAASVQRVRDIVRQTGSLAKVEQLISDYIDQANNVMDSLTIEDTARTHYEFLIGKLRHREA